MTDEYYNYKLAVALLRFKAAYAELVDASERLPGYDIGEAYPFYLLDFEQIKPAVQQWCTIHAAKLMRDLPDKVDNAACINCDYFRKGIGADGQCLGQKDKSCIIYPFIQFSREMAIAAMPEGVNLSNLSDDELHLLYMRHMDTLYATKVTEKG